MAKWGAADPAQAQALRARVRRAQTTLSVYASEGERYALRGRSDGYRESCEFRSAIKLLTDDYDEVIVDPFAREALDDFDEELREVAADATPVHRKQISSCGHPGRTGGGSPTTST